MNHDVDQVVSILENQRSHLLRVIQQSERARAILPHLQKALEEAQESKDAEAEA